MPDPRSPGFGAILREWRNRRRLSQLDLSVTLGVSARHISFIETGRSSPSREMVLKLAEHLDLPLRQRNRMLDAAGFAPQFRQRPLDAPDLSAALNAIVLVLKGHEPYPALAVDRAFNLVRANAAAEMFFADVDPVLLEPPVNMLRIGLHPKGMAPRIANLPQVWHGLMTRVERIVDYTGDAELTALHAELAPYAPMEVPVPDTEAVALPIRLRHHGEELAFISTMTHFGTAVDITLAEISIEAYFPADDHTAKLLRADA